MAAPPDPAVVGPNWEKLWRERLESTPSILETWTSHQRYDSYWRRASPDIDYAAIKCPVYVVDGWGDPYSNCIGELLEHLRVPRKGLIGPWGQYIPQPGDADRSGLALRGSPMVATLARQVDTGLMKEPMLRAYMMYQADSQAFPAEVPGRWVAEMVWPSRNVNNVPLYLAASGALSDHPASTRT